MNVGIATALFLVFGQAPGKATEKWLDLTPGPDLAGWKRVPIAPDVKPGAKNPWKMDGKILLCDGVDVKEMLLYDKEFKDGVFHVEWRFRKVEGKPEYNSGIYVRNSADGKVWHQAQVAHVGKPPRLGDLFGETLVDGKPQKSSSKARATSSPILPGSGTATTLRSKARR